MIFGVIALVVVLLIVFWWIGTMNSLRRLQVKIKESLSGIDVALTKRYDTLTKMVDVAKSYAKFEKETILGAVKLRQGMSMDERKTAMANMDEARQGLNILAENYPQLHANENYKALQVSIMDVEEHLAASRRAYNANVSSLNQSIVMFPTSLVANSCGITAEAFFEAEDVKRNDVKMDLDI